MVSAHQNESYDIAAVANMCAGQVFSVSGYVTASHACAAH
jgi:hypothetical protein